MNTNRSPKPPFQSWVSLHALMGKLLGVSDSDDWQGVARTVREHLAKLLAAKDPRGEVLARSISSPYSDAVFQTELAWDVNGRPYYKIWPAMCEMMRHTSINISASYFRPPFGAFEIRVPRGVFPYQSLASSVLVGACRRDTAFCRFTGRPDTTVAHELGLSEDQIKNIQRAAHEWVRQNRDSLEAASGHRIAWHLTYCYQTMDDRSRHSYSTSFYVLYEGMTIQESLDATLKRPCADALAEADRLSDDDLSAMLRIIIATCFFAIDNHEMVFPDIPREHLVVNARTKGQRISERQRVSRLLARCKGWLVGSEIDLPRPLVHWDGQPKTTGRELRYGHVRSGHMRMQPCGKGSKDRKLIFLAPTFVRPDLPVRAGHGYRIQDKLLKRGESFFAR